MKIIKRFICTFVVISLILTGCWNSNIDKTKEYGGGELIIGIIGSTPEVKEVQVRFEKIDFEFLRDDIFDSQYDAIFITRDNLSEASKAKYATIYKNSKIPFYFIESEKGHVPFTEEELSYEDVPDFKDMTYITGLLCIRDKVWGYGLYNDTKSEINVKGVYSRVFEDISEI